MHDRHATSWKNPCWICGRVNSHDHTTAEWTAAEWAVAAEKARIRAEVEKLDWTNTGEVRWGDDITLREVLAIIDGEDRAEEDRCVKCRAIWHRDGALEHAARTGHYPDGSPLVTIAG